jgi:hypothetical protein
LNRHHRVIFENERFSPTKLTNGLDAAASGPKSPVSGEIRLLPGHVRLWLKSGRSCYFHTRR